MENEKKRRVNFCYKAKILAPNEAIDRVEVMLNSRVAA